VVVEDSSEQFVDTKRHVVFAVGCRTKLREQLVGYIHQDVPRIDCSLGVNTESIETL